MSATSRTTQKLLRPEDINFTAEARAIQACSASGSWRWGS
jgi:hypothetical protein